jgi:hypothetical protein
MFSTTNFPGDGFALFNRFPFFVVDLRHG